MADNMDEYMKRKAAYKAQRKTQLGFIDWMFRHPLASATVSLGVTCALFIGALLAIKVIFF